MSATTNIRRGRQSTQISRPPLMFEAGSWVTAGGLWPKLRRTLAGFIALAAAMPATSQSLPLEPVHESGASVTGAFEGWFRNQDGSYGLLLGYFNRNQKQDLDIPIGPDNRIEPGGPDRGQPTHFLPGRQWGLFAIPAPREFKPTDEYVWTLVANGQTTSIPLRMKADYVMSPFQEIAVGNTPPVIRFEPNGK